VSKYAFSIHQRWAVFKAHGERCYLGLEPINLKSMQVDHIVPESLLEDRFSLEGVLTSLGLPEDFDLNSYENWMPACGPCNNQKRARVFEPAPIITLQLAKARDAAAKCRALEASSVSEKDVATALTYLERASEQERLDHARLKPLILAYARADPDAWNALIGELDGVKGGSPLGFLQVPEFRIAPGVRVQYKFGRFHFLENGD
jgi:hypothetical protein